MDSGRPAAAQAPKGGRMKYHDVERATLKLRDENLCIVLAAIMATMSEHAARLEKLEKATHRKSQKKP
jgi:hypothetical protein